MMEKGKILGAYRDGDIIVGEDQGGVDAGKFTVRHVGGLYGFLADKMTVQVADFSVLSSQGEQALKDFQNGKAAVFVFCCFENKSLSVSFVNAQKVSKSATITTCFWFKNDRKVTGSKCKSSCSATSFDQFQG